MADNFWWDTHKDNGCISGILKFSDEARRWYLKTDIKVRLKRFILHHVEFEEIVQMWKRLQIVKKDYGEETGAEIIQQAIKEIKAEFSNCKWAKTINEKIANEREELNDDFVKLI